MAPPDDDSEFELFMEMSDEELDRELATALREHDEQWNRMTIDQQLRYRRRLAVEGCLRWRRLIREWPELDLLRENLRNRQLALVKIRHERTKGISPGAA